MTKTCTACCEAKPLDHFCRHKGRKDGLSDLCKPCNRAKVRAWQRANPERAKVKHAEWKVANRGRYLASLKAHHERNKECDASKRAAWRVANRDKLKSYRAAYYAEHREKMIAASTEWQCANRRRKRSSWRAWYHATKDDRKRALQVDPQRRVAKAAADRKRSARWRVAHPERDRELKRAWSAAHPENASIQKTRRRAREAMIESTVTRGDIRETLEYFGRRCAYCLRSDVKLTVDHVTAIAVGGPDTPENIVPACQSCNSRKGHRGVLSMLNRCASASR